MKKVLLQFANSFQEHREDLSAVLLTDNNYLWLGSDETSTIERLSFVEEGKFAEHKQFNIVDFIDLPAKKEEEIDIEGIDFCNHYLWFIGSHSSKRKKVKPDKTDEQNIERLSKIVAEPNRFIIGRIPLVNGELLKEAKNPDNPALTLTAAKLQLTLKGNSLMEALADDPHLALFIQAGIPGKDNGFDIEGIAVYQDKIFLGLRGPVLRGWAMMLEIEMETYSPSILTLKKITLDNKRYKKHFIKLNGLGIRDLRVVGEDLLFLAGPTMDLDGPAQLYRLQNGAHLQDNILHQPELVMDIPYGKGDDRAEGITMFDGINGANSLLVVYDTPAKHRLIGLGGVMADVFDIPC
jgi:hypothetical protein